jgi:hypothetical protein
VSGGRWHVLLLQMHRCCYSLSSSGVHPTLEMHFMCCAGLEIVGGCSDFYCVNMLTSLLCAHVQILWRASAFVYCA